MDSFTLCVFLISIHASAREATRRVCLAIIVAHDFNPRLREGGDLVESNHLTYMCRFQSTPPRGRRREGLLKKFQTVPFQSTPPRGRRLSAVYGLPVMQMDFNPRLREGGDSLRLHQNTLITYFNPRLREGGDL